MCVCVSGEDRGGGGGEGGPSIKWGTWGGGVPNFLLGRGDKREKGRLM